ncbi:hypothetical protein LCGC14_1713280 [marine sediment metagenome]|uniref:Metallo-beta-lactamase domain-containing protein n=1 Tax=marine sediment metagenome TaxID=412755 RepID=A0A0F9JV20_9ZZZZ
MKFVSHYSSSHGNFYSVHEDGSALGLECGVSITRMQRALHPLGLTVAGLDGILLTHSHGDHARAAHKVVQAGVPLWASTETLEALHLGRPWARPVRPRRRQAVGAWQVLPFTVEHDAPGSLGFLVLSPSGEKLLFTMDTAFIPHRFVGLTVIAMECNFSTEQLRASHHFKRHRVLRHHMSVERLVQFLVQVDMATVREIHLLHVSNDLGDPAMFRQVVEQATGRPVFVAERQATDKC